MSTNRAESGTQSPPLEATGSHIPMGYSSIHGGKIEIVSDSKQRERYFSSENAEVSESTADPKSANVEKTTSDSGKASK
ncbi:hypothetical protein BDN72DRAFT_895087 [Pluteus cervinus]|uniref:Uncharacterized protein n=1 Tax=Pluteus cervinus TaxID=181527 RepID=A0ACD3B3A9_9AGAR|nr:hypothetical protein BDN72DRAFT_895087 [Pluteus cervinus]